MAFPTIPTVAAGRVLTGVQTGTSGTRTFPSLTGLTKNSGDLLIAICFCYQSSVTPAFSAWGAGFTEFVDSGSGTTMAIGAAYKWSDGTETGTFTVTQAATITGAASFILLSIPGAHASTVPEGGSRADGTSAAADPAAFDPAGWGAEDNLFISVGGSGETSTTGSFTGIASAPTNYTDYADTGISSDVVGGVEGAVAFRQLNGASENVGVFSVDVSNARNAALVIAVRPAAAPVTFDQQVAGTGAVTLDLAVTKTLELQVAGSGAVAVAIAETKTLELPVTGQGTVAAALAVAKDLGLVVTGNGQIQVALEVPKLLDLTVQGQATVSLSVASTVALALVVAGQSQAAMQIVKAVGLALAIQTQAQIETEVSVSRPPSGPSIDHDPNLPYLHTVRSL